MSVAEFDKAERRVMHRAYSRAMWEGYSHDMATKLMYAHHSNVLRRAIRIALLRGGA